MPDVQLYEITVSPNDWNRYQIEGEHPLSLPPVHCDACKAIWKGRGEAYPGTTSDVIPPDASQPLSVEKLQELRFLLGALVPPGAPLYPGAEFGEFRGRARGRFFDFAWHESWTMFLQLDALRRLRDFGVSIPRVAPLHLTPKGSTKVPELVEPVAIPLFELAREGLKDPDVLPCEKCGRVASGFRAFLAPSGAVLPEGVDLCRARNNPGVYIGSELLANAVESLSLTGCVMKPLASV
jgi:uncharacterized double-CXXCG motif protein